MYCLSLTDWSPCGTVEGVSTSRFIFSCRRQLFKWRGLFDGWKPQLCCLAVVFSHLNNVDHWELGPTYHRILDHILAIAWDQMGLDFGFLLYYYCPCFSFYINFEGVNEKYRNQGFDYGSAAHLDVNTVIASRSGWIILNWCLYLLMWHGQICLSISVLPNSPPTTLYREKRDFS